MFRSQILSKLSRLGLLSVFCAGLFITSGELSMNNTGGFQIGNGGIQSAMAEEVPKPTQATNPVDTTVDSLVTLMNLGIGTLTFLVTPLIMLAGWLLSPDWTFGDIFNLRPILHSLWILVSNVVYVIFGFLLVFVAFANIFGGEHSKAYEMKSMLPKLVTGMLIVPFTWFIVSATLSIANVLTASVIQLPVSTIKSNSATSGMLGDKIIPKTVYYVKWADFWSGTTWNGTDGGWEWSFSRNKEFAASDCSGGKNSDCLTIEEFLSNSTWGAYNLLSVYAYGIFKIQDFKAITVEQWINKVLDIASKLSFGIIFFIIFGILVIAIVYALFSRALMLWLYAIFSPLFALTYVLGDKAKKLEKFSFKEFISLALVPVYVSAALAFGLMFLGLVMWATSNGTTWPGWKLWENGRVVETAGDTTTFTFWDIKLTTVWLLTSENAAGVSGVLSTGKGIIGTIIINVLALVILWMAVMAALGASKITESAVAPIKWFGDEIGKLAMKAPQYVPIPLPGGKDKSISMAGMGSIVGPIKNSLDNMAQQQWVAIWKQFAPKWDMLSQKSIDLQTKTASNMQEAAMYAKDMLSAGKSDNFALNNNARGVLTKHLDSLNNHGWFDRKEDATKLIKSLGDTTNALEIRKILSKLDGLSESKGYGSLVWGKGKVAEGDIDSYIGKGEKIVESANITPIKVTLPGNTTPSDLQVHITTPAVWNNHAKIDTTELDRLLAELKAVPATKDITIEQLTKALKDKNIDIW